MSRSSPDCAPTPAGIEDAPESELARDVVPTINDIDDIVAASYMDWDPARTKIVMYRVGNDVYPGKFAVSREEARADCELVHGRIYEANYVQGRAFFRVNK